MIGDDEVIYSEYGSTRHGAMAGSNLVTAQDRGLQHYICIPLYPTISILHPPPGMETDRTQARSNKIAGEGCKQNKS